MKKLSDLSQSKPFKHTLHSCVWGYVMQSFWFLNAFLSTYINNSSAFGSPLAVLLDNYQATFNCVTVTIETLKPKICKWWYKASSMDDLSWYFVKLKYIAQTLQKSGSWKYIYVSETELVAKFIWAG